MAKTNKMKMVHQDKKENKILADLETQLIAATAEQEKRLAGSKEHLLHNLEVAAEKYLTVNGYMQVRTTIDVALFGQPVHEDVNLNALARNLAAKMSAKITEVAERIRNTDVMEIGDDTVGDLLDKSFVFGEPTLNDVVMQLLTVQLLQNMGDSIDDIVQFRGGTQDGIERITEEIAKHAESTEE